VMSFSAPLFAPPLVGWLAVLCSAGIIVPQTMTALRERRFSSLSPLSVLFYCFSSALWTGYGLLGHDVPLWSSSALALVPSWLALGTVMRHRGSARAPEQTRSAVGDDDDDAASDAIAEVCALLKMGMVVFTGSSGAEKAYCIADVWEADELRRRPNASPIFASRDRLEVWCRSHSGAIRAISREWRDGDGSFPMASYLAWTRTWKDAA
jgi:uncharacterized protein with PQ loop repeat